MMVDFKRSVRKRFLAVFFLLSLLTACGSREYLVRPAPQLAQFNRVAVFPFENLSSDPEAGDRVTNMVVSELHNVNVLNVVEPGEVQQFIIRSRIRFASQLDLDLIREASRQLNADGIMFGCVNEYDVIPTDLGPLPAVSLTVRLVNASNGDIVWASTYSLQGDYKETFFGIGRVNSPSTLAEAVVGDVVEGLKVAMYPGLARKKPLSNETTLKGGKSRPSTEVTPVLPLSPSPVDAKQEDAEEQKAHTDVLREWDTIQKLSK